MVALACILGAGILAARSGVAAAAGDPIVVARAPYYIGDPPSGSSFSPNGDGREDTTFGYYLTSRAANVDITVTRGLGETVRTLEIGVSHPAGTQSWDWNSRDDFGEPVTDGLYTITIDAIDSDGNAASLSVQRAVDTRIPGHLLQPAPGDLLRGTVTATFYPSPGFPVLSVSLPCIGSLSEQPDGT